MSTKSKINQDLLVRDDKIIRFLTAIVALQDGEELSLRYADIMRVDGDLFSITVNPDEIKRMVKIILD